MNEKVWEFCAGVRTPQGAHTGVLTLATSLTTVLSNHKLLPPSSDIYNLLELLAATAVNFSTPSPKSPNKPIKSNMQTVQPQWRSSSLSATYPSQKPGGHSDSAGPLIQQPSFSTSPRPPPPHAPPSQQFVSDPQHLALRLLDFHNPF